MEKNREKTWGSLEVFFKLSYGYLPMSIFLLLSELAQKLRKATPGFECNFKTSDKASRLFENLTIQKRIA